MFWVVQGNLSHENNFKNLIEILENFDIPHLLVKPVPQSLNFVSVDFDSFQKEHSVSDEPYVNSEQDIMVIGSYTLSKIAKSRGWRPGAFMENMDFNSWKQGWGEDNLLNGEAIVASLGDIEIPSNWPKFFARPLEDTKSFSGTVFERDNFTCWKNQVLSIEGYSTLPKETQIIISPLKEIQREYRLFVVDSKIVTGSLYKLKDQVIYHENIDPEIITFAQNMIDTWQPDRGFCLDVAMTADGCKIIEVNGLNSAGFYASDLQKLVGALESMTFPKKSLSFK